MYKIKPKTHSYILHKSHLNHNSDALDATKISIFNILVKRKRKKKRARHTRTMG